jgi:hypothetical protein
VSASPEELVAVGALEEVGEPFVRCGRDAVAGLLFIDLDELAAATHAGGFTSVKDVLDSWDKV